MKLLLWGLLFYIPGFVCRRHCDPTGSIHCIYIPRYGGYQWASCRTNIYIKTKSQGSHQCQDSLATTCYYQCMLDNYKQNSGQISSTCQCSTNDPKPTEIPLPDWCYSPSGTDCNWYKECLSKAYPQCQDDKDEYAINFAEKFCNLYTQNLKIFSSNGQKWVNAVRKCLQVKLVPTIDKYRKKTCGELKNLAFETHTPCYINPDGSSLSVCDLSPTDLGKVFWTIKGSFLSAFSPSVKGLWDVSKVCTPIIVKDVKDKIDKAVENIVEPFKKISQKIKLTIKEMENRFVHLIINTQSRYNLRYKRSLTNDDDNKQSQLGGKIIDDLAIQDKWKDKGLVWFAYVNNSNPDDKKTLPIHVLLDDANKYNSSLNPANISNTLIVLAERIMQGTLKVKMDNNTFEVEGIKGCLDEECEIFSFNVTTTATTLDLTTNPTPTTGINMAINLNGRNYGIFMILLLILCIS